MYNVYYRMNNFIDVCKLLGNYNDKDVSASCSKYKSNSIFIVLIIIYYQNGQILRN